MEQFRWTYVPPMNQLYCPAYELRVVNEIGGYLVVRPDALVWNNWYHSPSEPRRFELSVTVDEAKAEIERAILMEML